MTGITKKNVRLANFVRSVRKQKTIESFFSEKSLHKMVKEEISQNMEIMKRVHQGTDLINEWLSQEYYESKQQRLEAIKELDIHQLVFDIAVIITMKCKTDLPLVSVASLCAYKLNMLEQGQAIQTITEMIAVLSDTDLFDLNRPNKYAQITVKTNIELCAELAERAQYAQFLPPMLHRPRTLRNNRHSGYWSQSGDSVILGGYENHHDDHISLDVLNTLNKNVFELDTEFLSSVEETPSTSQLEAWEEAEEDYETLSRQQKELLQLEQDNWEHYKLQCYTTYAMMIHHGNKFYFNHKVDKRGRIYTYGYHINPQGNSFKKAMLNFAHKQKPTGVDDFLSDCK